MTENWERFQHYHKIIKIWVIYYHEKAAVLTESYGLPIFIHIFIFYCIFMIMLKSFRGWCHCVYTQYCNRFRFICDHILLVLSSAIYYYRNLFVTIHHLNIWGALSKNLSTHDCCQFGFLVGAILFLKSYGLFPDVSYRGWFIWYL